jgi:hypothetical protein
MKTMESGPKKENSPIGPRSNRVSRRNILHPLER